jgi:hypothetical protein
VAAVLTARAATETEPAVLAALKGEAEAAPAVTPLPDSP